MGNDLTEANRLVDEAIEIAREVNAPTTLAAALHRKIFLPFGPNATEERLEIARARVEFPGVHRLSQADCHVDGRRRSTMLRESAAKLVGAHAHVLNRLVLGAPQLRGYFRERIATEDQTPLPPRHRGGDFRRFMPDDPSVIGDADLVAPALEKRDGNALIHSAVFCQEDAERALVRSGSLGRVCGFFNLGHRADVE